MHIYISTSLIYYDNELGQGRQQVVCRSGNARKENSLAPFYLLQNVVRTSLDLCTVRSMSLAKEPLLFLLRIRDAPVSNLGSRINYLVVFLSTSFKSYSTVGHDHFDPFPFELVLSFSAL
jgi:hypothetical protein